MFRKTILALAAIGALGAAALAPTSASAWGGWHGGWGHHRHFGGFWGPRFGFYAGPAYAYGYDSCLRRRWVATPFGMRLRVVNVCVY